VKIKAASKAAMVAGTAAAAAAVGLTTAPFASADPEVRYFGQPGELNDGGVVQHWTISGLKPSSDAIPYQPAGTLWEATATDEAVAGSVTPIIPDLNARARNGDTYRVLFSVATPQGVNPSTLAQGEKTTGKIYFDVTGERPDSVFYAAGTDEQLLWVEAPPAPATPVTGGNWAPADTGSTSSGAAEGAAAEESTAPEPGVAPASAAPAPGEALPAGSSGTPLPEGSTGTPLPTGSSGTPLPAGSATQPAGTMMPAEASPAPAPAAVSPVPQPETQMPAGSAGTPLPEGSSGTPAPAQTPATTVVVPPPA
jgi:hypothetical protein